MFDNFKILICSIRHVTKYSLFGTLAWPPHARAFPRALAAMEQLRELIREEVSFEITSYDFVSVISFILACIIVKLVVVVKVMKG